MADADSASEDGGRPRTERAKKKRKSGAQVRQTNPNASSGVRKFSRLHPVKANRQPRLSTYSARAALSVSRALVALVYGRRMRDAASIVPAVIQAFGHVPESIYLLAFEVLRALPGRGQQANLFLRRLGAIDVKNAAARKLALACHQMEGGRTGDARHTLSEISIAHGAGACDGAAIVLSAALAFQHAVEGSGGSGRANASGMPGTPGGGGSAARGAGFCASAEPAPTSWELRALPSAAGRGAREEQADQAKAALDAIGAADATGASSSGLEFCRAQLSALGSARADDALALMREHARQRSGELGACLAFLRTAQLCEAAGGAAAGGAAAGVAAGGAVADVAAGAAAGAPGALGLAPAHEDALRTLADAAVCVLRLDPSCDAAHAALQRGADGCRAAGAAAALPTGELVGWAAARVEYAPLSADAWAGLASALQRLSAERLQSVPQPQPPAAVSGGAEAEAAEAGVALGGRAQHRQARREQRSAALGAQLRPGGEAALVGGGSEWGERLGWWTQTFFRAAEHFSDRPPWEALPLAGAAGAPDGAERELLAPKLAVAAMLFGRRSALLQRTLYAHAAAAARGEETAQARLVRRALKRARKDYGVHTKGLEDWRVFGALAAAHALVSAASGEGAGGAGARALLAAEGWAELCSRVGRAHPSVGSALAAAEAGTASEVLAGVREEVDRWLQTQTAH